MLQRTCVCLVCKTQFTTSHPRQVYCSRPCTVLGNNAKQNAKTRRHFEPRPCLQCGEAFTPKRADGIEFCSRLCGARARYVPRVKPDHAKTCEYCGETFSSKRSDARFCREMCYDRLHAGVPRVRCCEMCGHDISQRPATSRFCVECYNDRKAWHGRQGVRATCDQCGDDFVAATGAQRFCGPMCVAAASRAAQFEPVMTLDCAACGSTFETRDVRVATCSETCRQWINRHPDDRQALNRECPLCLRRFVASGMSQVYCCMKCTAAASSRRCGRVMKPYVVATDCLACGDPLPTGRFASMKYCSVWCRSAYLHNPDRFTERFGRTCERCGASVDDHSRVDRRFCTSSCQVKMNAEIRRARRRGLPTERISRAVIFSRDEMICHICGKVITSLPTLDHIIPISHPACPGHVWENVAAAHRRCNIGKRDRVRPADLDLYERLRKERQLMEVSVHA